jgi:hypothetical protein
MTRLLLWLLLTAAIFSLGNGASYFLRSDGFAMGLVQDGLLRCGFPLLFWERGGFGYHEYFFPVRLLEDLGACLIAAGAVMVLMRWRRNRNH